MRPGAAYLRPRRSDGRPWRNWQTRTVQVRVPKGVVVRLHSGAPFSQQPQTDPGSFHRRKPPVADPSSFSLRFPAAADQSRKREGEAVADWATMRAVWEPRMLSILRIMTGLLFLQHGTNKFFNFPTVANPRAYDLWTLSPGLQGIIELVGGLLI